MQPLRIIERPCARHDRRPAGGRPEVVVIHFSATLTVEEIFQIFLHGPTPVSAHYVIGDEGDVWRLVDERLRAWHAGRSAFAGRPAVNDFSVGIELRNAGRLTPGADGRGLFTVLGAPFRPGNPALPAQGDWWESYAEPQMRSLIRLCREICGQHGIPPDHVVGHSDVALPPGRKIDPGPLFDWRRLRAELAEESPGA